MGRRKKEILVPETQVSVPQKVKAEKLVGPLVDLEDRELGSIGYMVYEIAKEHYASRFKSGNNPGPEAIDEIVANAAALVNSVLRRVPIKWEQ